MISGTLKNGFEYQIQDCKLDSMELVDAIVEIDTNPLAISKVVSLLLDPEDKKRLYDSVRTPDGNVPMTAVSEAVIEIFQANQKAKNS